MRQDKKVSWKENWMLLVILPVILVVCFCVWWVRIDTVNEVVVVSDTAEWHLQGHDFDEIFVRTWGSTVEYVPGALLTPEEFENADYSIGDPKNVADYVTTRVRLYVPDGRAYFLTTDSLDFAERIYINGHLYQEVGQPATSREAMIPKTTTVCFTVTPQNGVIEIVRQASNFVHREADFKSPFRIGSAQTAGRHYNRILIMSTVLASFGWLLFIVHMVLYLLQRGNRANLYFAFLCLVWCIYTGITEVQAAVLAFPNIPWALTFRVEYISVPICTLLAMLALDALFEGLVQRGVKWAATGALLAASVAYMFLDTYTMSYLILGTNPLCIAIAAYLVVRLLWRARQKDNRSIELIIVLCGLGMLACALLRDTLYHFASAFLPAVHANLTEFVLPTFILFQMVANFSATMRKERVAVEQRQMLFAENAALDRVNQMKNELMADLTHELRTPLSVMSAYAQLAVKSVQEGNVDEQTAEDLKLIRHEAERLADMATDVLQVFRQNENAGSMGAFSMGMVMEQVARLMSPMLKKTENTLVLHMDENLPYAFGRVEECTQLLWNLIANANSHTQNGSIDIIAVADNAGGMPMIAVSVKDNGSGIAPQLLPHIFERYKSDTHGGSGLGLPICQEIVEAHGGNITVESVEGKGTTVRFTMPATEGENA